MSTQTRYMLSDAERQRILDELDRAESARRSSRRQWERLEYRLRGIPALIEHPNGSTARVLVPTRNVSCGGISVLTTCFLHVGTKITVALPDMKGSHKACAGKVAFCRFICGRVHEIGVAFVEQINLEDFEMPESGMTGPDEGRTAATRTPLAGTVVVVSGRDVERVLAVNRLRQTGLIPAGVKDPAAALDRVRAIGASVVVVDLALGPEKTQNMLVSLSEFATMLPVVGMVFPADPDAARRAVQEGMMGCVVAPLAFADVHETMSKAISSGQAYHPAEGAASGAGGAGDDEDAPAMVRFFVTHCGEMAGKIREALGERDHAAAAALCKGLQNIAPGYGFRSVAFAAREAHASLNATGSTDESADRLAALLNVLDRVAPATGLVSETANAHDGAGTSGDNSETEGPAEAESEPVSQSAESE